MIWSTAGLAAATNQTPAVTTGDKAPLATFMVERGFRIEQVASQPMVSSPVALAFDENGRLFVAEMRDASPGAAGPRLGSVRILEEPDEQGVFKTSTVFADDLPLPSAIACYAGGVFVAASSNVFYLKATHGGGADVKRIVLTGFGTDSGPASPRLLNNFNWGPDDRIHSATAGVGAVITAPGWGGGQTLLAGCNFSFNPRTLSVQTETGPAESGLTFDNFGREFACGYAHPFQQAMYELRYPARNPYYAPPPLRDVASPATPIFRFDPAWLEQASRASATRSGLRPARLPNGIVPGWLTQARGCVIYRGSTFPSSYFGNAFIADPENHIIHRAVLAENGLEIAASRAREETNTEFVISRDDSFRPAQIVNGPDGALYVADMEAGGDRGRILRIVPERFKAPPAPQLGRAKTLELAPILANSNGWQRDTAARLLFEQQDTNAMPLLAQMAQRARLPLVRVQALRALAEAGGLREANALNALQDPDPRMREAAIQASEKLVTQGTISSAIWDRLRGLAGDPDIQVRCQVAFTVGEIHRPDKLSILAQILTRDLRNPYVQNAVLSSLGDDAGAMLVYLAGNSTFQLDPAGQRFLRQLALMTGLRGRLAEVTGAMNFIANSSLDWAYRYGLLAEIGEGLHRTRSSFSLVDPQSAFGGLYTAAMGIAGGGVAEALQVDAIRVIEAIPYSYANAGDWLLLQCSPQPYRAVQSAALVALGRYNDPRVLPGLLGYWSAMSPELRKEAVSALLSRTERIGPVLDAVDRGQIPIADVGAVDRNFLRTYPAVSQRAARLFGPVPQRRPEVVQKFKAALVLPGDAEHGRQLYLQRCAACHQPDAVGASLGPNPASARVRGREKVLQAIVEPNANVPPEFAPSVVQTQDGEILIGIKTLDNPVTLTLRQRAGSAVWPHTNIQSVQTQSWSLMPEGLEEGLGLQDMADLIDWVMSSGGSL